MVSEDLFRIKHVRTSSRAEWRVTMIKCEVVMEYSHTLSVRNDYSGAAFDRWRIQSYHSSRPSPRSADTWITRMLGIDLPGVGEASVHIERHIRQQVDLVEDHDIALRGTYGGT